MVVFFETSKAILSYGGDTITSVVVGWIYSVVITPGYVRSFKLAASVVCVPQPELYAKDAMARVVQRRPSTHIGVVLRRKLHGPC